MSEYILCETKLGWVGAVIRGGHISATILPAPDRERALQELVDLGGRAPAEGATAATISERLRRCTEGDGREFTAGELDMDGATPFQQAVWRAMLEIPRGQTRSYAWVAERIGRPGAARAVGQAVGSNRLPIVVPCHRVIGSDGSLHGFGGGLPMKSALLQREGVALT